jgi:hypothetical protein
MDTFRRWLVLDVLAAKLSDKEFSELHLKNFDSLCKEVIEEREKLEKLVDEFEKSLKDIARTTGAHVQSPEALPADKNAVPKRVIIIETDLDRIPQGKKYMYLRQASFGTLNWKVAIGVRNIPRASSPNIDFTTELTWGEAIKYADKFIKDPDSEILWKDIDYYWISYAQHMFSDTKEAKDYL